MKRLTTILKVLFAATIINVGLFTIVNGNGYLCDNGSCMTMIQEDEGGYSWRITCDDGSYEEGRTNGASYDGECEAIESEV
jgi:hypothetical protein